jgi:hypothetical protein
MSMDDEAACRWRIHHGIPVVTIVWHAQPAVVRTYHLCEVLDCLSKTSQAMWTAVYAGRLPSLTVHSQHYVQLC